MQKLGFDVGLPRSSVVLDTCPVSYEQLFTGGPGSIFFSKGVADPLFFKGV